jgi:hypothetical protein
LSFPILQYIAEPAYIEAYNRIHTANHEPSIPVFVQNSLRLASTLSSIRVVPGGRAENRDLLGETAAINIGVQRDVMVLDENQNVDAVVEDSMKREAAFIEISDDADDDIPGTSLDDDAITGREEGSGESIGFPLHGQDCVGLATRNIHSLPLAASKRSANVSTRTFKLSDRKNRAKNARDLDDEECQESEEENMTSKRLKLRAAVTRNLHKRSEESLAPGDGIPVEFDMSWD